MVAFAQEALQGALKNPEVLGRALGEYLTEPKANVWFEPVESAGRDSKGPVCLDRRTKMMFDARHIFINGESFSASGRDATLMRRLADERCLSRQDLARTSTEARALMQSWGEAGWLHGL
jgi:50S ribosomal protein L16 3-hydroxylase